MLDVKLQYKNGRMYEVSKTCDPEVVHAVDLGYADELRRKTDCSEAKYIIETYGSFANFVKTLHKD